jgi:hypothetical protein
MVNLLAIPQELRDRILELALSTIDSTPQNPGAATDYVELHDNKHQTWCNGTHVRYPNRPVTPTALSLLLVNRRLHADMLALLARIRPPFEMDVMLVEDRQIWATWLSVGTFTPKVDRVHVSFRIFPRSTPVQEIGNTGSRRNDDETPVIFWQLYSLLERMLLCGPVGAYRGSKKGFVSIDILELDVLTLSGTPARGRSTHDVRDGEEQEAVRAEQWVTTISRGIFTLLEMYHGVASKGQIFYERVGKIRVMLDGKLLTETDLTTSLAEMQYSILVDGFYPNSETRWWRVMKKIRRNREQAGLPVLPFTELQEV